MTCIFSIGSSCSFFLSLFSIHHEEIDFTLPTTYPFHSFSLIFYSLSLFLSLFPFSSILLRYFLVTTQHSLGIIYMPWTTLSNSIHSLWRSLATLPTLLADSSWSWFWHHSTWRIPILSHPHRHLGIQPNKTTQCPEKGNAPRSYWSWVYYEKRK